MSATVSVFATDRVQLGLPGANAANDLTRFDDPDEWIAFSQRLDAPNGEEPLQLVQSFMHVMGMRCAACSLALEAALLGVEGVTAAQVSAASATASVTWSTARTRPSAWMGSGLELGYRLFPRLDSEEQSAIREVSRLLLWRWLVAGFCMMQVMMYASPSYFSQPGDMTPDIAKLLRWASWVLCLPVMLFSCAPFFSNAWRDLRQRSVSMDLPVAIGMAVTFAVSTVATFEPQGRWGAEVYFDSLTMFVFFLLSGRWLEQRLRTRTAGALGALMQRLPVRVLRRTATGDFERVAARRLRIGDVVRVLPGEAFPADGVVIEGSTFADEALLTGESAPVERGIGAGVMAGSFNVANSALVRVYKLGATTRYAQIVALMEQAALDKPRLAELADKIAKPFLICVLLTAAAAAAFWWQTDPARALMAAVAVLVVTCPCALSLATPSAMLTSAGLLARNGVLVRRLQAIESLADIDTVIFDKTGTLTETGMVLKSIDTRNNLSRDQALQYGASLAQHSLHPASRALLVAATGASLISVANVKELPGLGLEGWIAEPPSRGLLRLGSSSYCQVEEESRRSGAKSAILRVYLADRSGWMASFEFDEAIRCDAAKTIAQLQGRGLSVHILSGDTPVAAQRVAGLLGIPAANASGGCTPDGKLAQLKALQAQGRHVLMVGDGLNDGPTLAAAHASVAVGAAVALAQAQSDFLIPGAQLLILPAMLAQAKRTLRVVKQNLAWAAIYNATCVPLALAGYLPAWLAGLGMALSSLLVIANAARLSAFQASN